MVDLNIFLTTTIINSYADLYPTLGNRNVTKTVCPSGWGVVVVSNGGDKGPKENEGDMKCIFVEC